MKKEYTLYSLALFVILLIAMALGNYNSPRISLTKIEPTTLSMNLEKDYILEADKIEEVKDIAMKVASSHKYKLNSYDCTDFSRELTKQLKKEGYNAQCTAGYYTEQGEAFRHTWVSLWIENQRVGIESTRGYFIDEEKSKNYRIKMESYCW